METEKLIAALRNNYSPDLHVIEDMQKAADMLECLTARNAAKDAEIERLKKANKIASAVWDSSALCAAEADRDRLQAELDAAKKCVNDVQTYLDLGSAKYIAATIKQWRGSQKGKKGEQ